MQEWARSTTTRSNAKKNGLFTVARNMKKFMNDEDIQQNTVHCLLTDEK